MAACRVGVLTSTRSTLGLTSATSAARRQPFSVPSVLTRPNRRVICANISPQFMLASLFESCCYCFLNVIYNVVVPTNNLIKAGVYVKSNLCVKQTIFIITVKNVIFFLNLEQYKKVSTNFKLLNSAVQKKKTSWKVINVFIIVLYYKLK